jgi:hypothetical protein
MARLLLSISSSNSNSRAKTCTVISLSHRSTSVKHFRSTIVSLSEAKEVKQVPYLVKLNERALLREIEGLEKQRRDLLLTHSKLVDPLIKQLSAAETRLSKETDFGRRSIVVKELEKLKSELSGHYRQYSRVVQPIQNKHDEVAQELQAFKQKHT